MAERDEHVGTPTDEERIRGVAAEDADADEFDDTDDLDEEDDDEEDGTV